MLSLTRSAALLLLLAALSAAAASAQPASTQARTGTATVTGRVTFKEKALGNIQVAAYASERPGVERTAAATARTDFEGRYRLSNLGAGRYNIVVMAPAMVGPSEGQFGDTGKAVTLAEGETVEKIDFVMVKGGVITGRVTDADGMPVIGERVNVAPAEAQGRNRYFFFSFSLDPFMNSTDDRGIYRIYGVPPGRYKISVGEALEGGGMMFGPPGRGFYTRTFHPNVTDEARANVVEIGEGSEATNVDISVGRKAKTFAASGRVLDESGQPASNVRLAYGSVVKDQRMGGFGISSTTDEKGQFRMEGLVPGRYAAYVWNDGQGDSYSEPVQFEVTEGDVSGLELKLKRGSSITGVAVVDGTADPAVLAKLSQVTIGAGPSQPNDSLALGGLTFVNTRLGPDGSFRLSGLRPGKYRIFLNTFPQPVAGFRLARVEREGVPQGEIEVTPGLQVTGIRLVLEHGTGRITGLVRVEGGVLPSGMRLTVSARRVGEPRGVPPRNTQVDARGRFVIEGVAPGDYEVTAQAFAIGDRTRRYNPGKQLVTVTNGVDAETTLTVTPAAGTGEENQP